MRLNRIKVGTRLIVAFLAVGVVPACVVGLIALYESLNALEAEAQSKMSGIAEYKTQMIENFVEDRMADVHAVPLTSFIVDAVHQLAEGAEEDKAAARVSLLREFQVSKKLHNYYNEMKVLDLGGDHLVSLQGIDQNESGKTWFKAALANAAKTEKDGSCQDLYVSTIEQCGELGVPSIHMAHVIRDRETFEPIAMYVVDVNIDAIQDLMSTTTGLGETGQTYLVGPDKVMRSNDRHETEPTILTKVMDTAGVADVFARREEKRGAEICNTLLYENDEGTGVLGHNHYLPELDLAVMTEIDEAEAFAPVRRMEMLMGIVGLIAVAAIGAIAWLVARGLSRPIVGMTGAMNKLADGDLETHVPAKGRGDEIGEMAQAVQVFKENAIRVREMEAEQAEQKRRAEAERRAAMHALADGFEQSVGGVIQTVTSASAELQASSEQMASTAEETSTQATTVASASEQASANVQTVASAAEELSSSISEISRQVAQASHVAKAAVQEAQETTQNIQGLAEAADKIGAVVALITDIADQTNLLALNATIEAARAGDAGKGFAVVASEVKNLANQTAKATDEIDAQISGIQTATSVAVSAIEKITKTISEIDEVAAGIASAVEQQGAATQEIARNVEQAAAGTQEVSSNIVSVNQAAGETGAAATQIRNSATELSQQSAMLKSEVAKFLDQVRADKAEMKLIEWSDDIACGVPSVDTDHRNMVDLLNRAYADMMTGAGGQAATRIVTELGAMIDKHFADEERLMSRIGYPNLDQHRKIHKKLLARFEELRGRYEAGDANSGKEMFEYLAEWLRNHTNKHDKAFVDYARSKGKDKSLLAA